MPPSRGEPVVCGLLMLLIVLVLVLTHRQSTQPAISEARGPGAGGTSPLSPLQVGDARLTGGRDRHTASLEEGWVSAKHSASDLFERAFYINAADSLRRRKFMEVPECHAPMLAGMAQARDGVRHTSDRTPYATTGPASFERRGL